MHNLYFTSNVFGVTTHKLIKYFPFWPSVLAFTINVCLSNSLCNNQFVIGISLICPI